METYSIRLHNYKGTHTMVSCSKGHSLACVNDKDGSFGGSRLEADLAFNKLKCRECEGEGRSLASRPENGQAIA